MSHESWTLVRFVWPSWHQTLLDRRRYSYVAGEDPDILHSEKPTQDWNSNPVPNIALILPLCTYRKDLGSRDLLWFQLTPIWVGSRPVLCICVPLTAAVIPKGWPREWSELIRGDWFQHSARESMALVDVNSKKFTNTELEMQLWTSPDGEHSVVSLHEGLQTSLFWLHEQ